MNTVTADVRPANTPTRRALVGAAFGISAAAMVSPASAAPGPKNDRRWDALVADYRAKRAAWVDVCDIEDDYADEVRAAVAALPPEPKNPGSGLPSNFDHMTFAEIKSVGDTPARKAAWVAYEADHAAWKAQRDAVTERVLAPAKGQYQAAYASYADALNGLTTYRVSTPHHIAEKIEIIAAEYEGAEIPQEYLADILADVRHLAGGAQQ